MVDAVPHIEEDEYWRWVPIQQVIRDVTGVMDFREAPLVLSTALRLGAVRAAAEQAVSETGSGIEERFRFVLMLPDSWAPNWTRNAASAFWSTGQLAVTLRRPHRPELTVTYLGVRLEPAGVAKLTPAPVVPSTAMATQDAAKETQKPLAPAERMRFAKLYAETFGNQATEAKALKAIRAAYDDNFVARDVFLADFRAIRGKQTPGRKGKTEN